MICGLSPRLHGHRKSPSAPLLRGLFSSGFPQLYETECPALNRVFTVFMAGGGVIAPPVALEFRLQANALEGQSDFLSVRSSALAASDFMAAYLP